MSTETASITAHTEKSGNAGVPSRTNQLIPPLPDSLAAEDIIESSKAMLSALTEVLQKTSYLIGTQLQEHSKCQMEQVNKGTEEVTQMASSHNVNKLAARSAAHPVNFDNSDSEEDDKGNDRRNRFNIHKTDRSLYNEPNLEVFFLSHQETLSSSEATTGKLEVGPMINSIFKEFSESYKKPNENWREPASDEVTNVV